MGSAKASLMVEGAPFLTRIYETMESVFSDVVVCGGPEVPSDDGVLVHDDFPGEGPVVGLLSALRSARGRPVFIAAVDMPLLTGEVMQAIADPPVTGSSARIAVVEGEDQPLVGAYGPDVERIVVERLAAGKRAMFGVLDDVDVVEYVVVDPLVLVNVNTIKDYDELIEKYSL